MRSLCRASLKKTRKVWIPICTIECSLKDHIKFNPKIYDSLLLNVIYTYRLDGSMLSELVVRQDEFGVKTVTVSDRFGRESEHRVSGPDVPIEEIKTILGIMS